MTLGDKYKAFGKELERIAVIVEKYIEKKGYHDNTVKIAFKYRGIFSGMKGTVRTDNVACFEINIPRNSNLEVITSILTAGTVGVADDVEGKDYHRSRLTDIEFVSAKAKEVY